MSDLIDLDKRLLLLLNGMHSDGLDPIMLLLTKTLVWLPLYFLLIFLLFRKYKKDAWLILAGVALAILLADRITSGIMKPFFARLRPSHEPSLQGLVHLVNGYSGGLYGFASGHAANTFAVAFLVWATLKKFYRWAFLVFIWAALMTYTRIYLGVHYPGDIITGIVIGLGCGWIGYQFFRWLKEKINPSNPAAS
jgi:undecaprenyl-diphosphatase